MLVPRERLPPSFAERHAALRDYFCDKDADATEVEDGWALSLGWPDGVERHVDPRLDEGLVWWGGGARRDTMAIARRREGRVLRALYDSWTLQSWSEWLARRGTPPNPLTILHVDDHEDLGSPRLFGDTDNWTDAISGERVSLASPRSVEAAIESGGIGMGSFLTPFLHALPHCDVRQLRQPPKSRATIDYKVVLTTTPDTLIAPGRARPAIALAKTTEAPGPGRMRITPDLNAWLADIGPGPILLHIDMDYFNNRYDGDSDWESRREPFDPDADTVLKSIDAMADALNARGLIERLEDLVVAFSPGFFPAELWALADARLKNRLKALYG
ncbi:MAG: hypothetical protein ACKVS5_10845 [Parvularculaceae bacterium]